MDNETLLVLQNHLIYDYLILKNIKNDKYTTMRKLKNELIVSLGFIHSRIELLLKQNIIICTDLSNGSRKKKYQYIITELGYAYKVELMQKIKEFMLIELEYMKNLI